MATDLGPIRATLKKKKTPEKQFFFLLRKKCPQAGFEPRTPTTNLEHTHALDRLAMASLH